jgi:hypothetical protein
VEYLLLKRKILQYSILRLARKPSIAIPAIFSWGSSSNASPAHPTQSS